MEPISWLSDHYHSEIQEAARQKIEMVRSFEAEIPAIFIVHDFREERVVYMSQRGLDILGISLNEVRMPNPEYHGRYFNPEDAAHYVPKIWGLIERNDLQEMITYFQQVRSSEHHDWTWYLSSTKIFLRDEAGKPLLILTMAVPIDSKSHITNKVERLMFENRFLAEKHHVFASLTPREKEVLQRMARGENSCEIAAALHISETTANTHRRNIRSKLKVQSNYDITRFAQAFDLI